MKHIPNILTLGRIGIIPLVVLCMLAGFNGLALFLFIVASITDFFDGYLARKYKVESKMGAMLDPIADKLLVAAILILLTPHLSGFAVLAVVIILLRELLVSGLREFLSANNIAMPVTKLAKYKTAVQMAAIAALLYSVSGFAVTLLWVAALLTAITGWQYSSYALAKLKNQ